MGLPKDLHYDELVTLLKHFGFMEMKKGKTAGSRRKFENKEGVVILIHKPHPTGIMKMYQIKQIKQLLEL